MLNNYLKQVLLLVLGVTLVLGATLVSGATLVLGAAVVLGAFHHTYFWNACLPTEARWAHHLLLR